MSKTIGAELILASKNRVTGDILYTFKLTFPRIILSEVNTHKIASRNTSSSRAIPVPSMMRRVREDPFVPLHWGTYKSGMQAGPPLTGWKRRLAIQIWKLGRWADLAEAWIDHKLLHLSKEITNRVYERYTWTEQLYSTTDLSNLLKLRNHWMAEPHFQICAGQIEAIRKMCDYVFSITEDEDGHTDYHVPPWWETIAPLCQILEPGHWHLPFASDPLAMPMISEAFLNPENQNWDLIQGKLTLADGQVLEGVFKYLDVLKRLSAGRCAWVSYYMPGDKSQKLNNLDLALSTYAKLAESDPKHLSPLEHQAVALPQEVRCGNFCGFMQFRKEIPGESGGDKVVHTILPEEAQKLLQEWELGHPWRSRGNAHTPSE